jgi:hypothetical protein
MTEEKKSLFDPALADGMYKDHVKIEDGSVTVDPDIYFHAMPEAAVKKLKGSIDAVNAHNARFDPNMAYAIGKANLEVLAADAGFEAVSTGVEIYGGRKVTVVTTGRQGDGDAKVYGNTSVSIRHMDEDRANAIKDARSALKDLGSELMNKD